MPTINVNQTNASETAKGIVEEATQAEVNAGTDTGATGAKVFVAPSKLLSLLGSYLTTASAAATYQTIAGLFASVMGLVLTGFSAGANTAIAATDTLAQALAKIQGQINARATTASVALKTDKLLTANRQTASYTLVLGDADLLVEMNVGSANNLTVPPNSSVAFSVGTQILIAQYGAGQTTVVADTGVTIRSNGGKLKLAAQYAGATLIKIATNEWYLFGDITT